MFAELKRLSKHISIYGLSNIIARSLSFLLLPLHTNLLDSTFQYGEAVLIFAYLGLANVIFLHGMDTAFLRFYLLKEPGFTNRNVFSTSLLSVFSVSIFLSIGTFFYAGSISGFFFGSPNNAIIIQWTAGILLFDSLARIPMLVLRAEERSVLFMFFSILNVAVTLSLNFYFVPDKGVEGIFIANFLASGVMVLILLPIVFSRVTYKVSSKVYAELLHFGLPYIVPGISIISMDLIDRFIIRYFHGEGMVGIYGAGYKMAMIMALAVGAFRFAWHPFFLSIASKENAKEIYARVLSYYVLVAGWIYLAISFFVRELATIPIPFTDGYLIDSKFWDGVSIVPIIMIAYVFYGVYVNFIVGIYLKKKSKYLVYITGISALANVGLNFLLIPRYGMTGAAVATVIAYALMSLTLVAVTRRFYPVNYEYKRLLHVVLVIGIMFVVVFVIPGGQSFFVKAGLVFFYPIVIFLTGFFKPEESNAIKSLIRSNPNSG